MKEKSSFFFPNELKRVHNRIIPISEEKKIATPLICKCGCSTLLKIALLSKGLNCETGKYENLSAWWEHCNDMLIDKEHLADYKIVAVVRNPLDRIGSAYNTVGNNMPVEDYVEKVIYTLENFEPCHIDRHIVSQFEEYSLSMVDEFVPIEYLDKYLHSIGIDIERINVSKSPLKINDERLKKLLSNDFRIYNEILNGDKCFKPL